MPDMPQQGGAQPPAQGAPAPQGQPPEGAAPPGGGGGIGDAITQADGLISKITQAVTQNAKLGDDVKGAWSDALTAVRGAAQALIAAVSGGGKPEPEGDEGPVSPEQGGGGAVPMTHAPMRG